LQETKLQQDLHSTLLTKDKYTQAKFNCSTAKKGYSGTALFAKDHVKILRTSFGLGEFLKEDGEGRAITVELEHFFFVGLYVANSGQNLVRLDYRINAYDVAVRNYLAALSKLKPVILGGDLNVAHMDGDVYNFDAPHLKKQAGCTKEERDSFSLLLSSQNRVDSFRFLYPESKVFSFWSTRAGNRPFNRGMRLDYFVVPREMMLPTSCVRLHDSWILDESPEKLSDHAPICCQLIVPASDVTN
jgi:exodeoxyribonuclease III